MYTFSAPTCLSVLNTMSDDMVLQEYNNWQSTHPDSTVRAQNPAARKKLCKTGMHVAAERRRDGKICHAACSHADVKI